MVPRCRGVGRASRLLYFIYFVSVFVLFCLLVYSIPTANKRTLIVEGWTGQRESFSWYYSV